jgi:putative FmdB family regulatory protein
MPYYEFQCTGCKATETKRLPMSECAAIFPHECGGTMRRILSADIQVNALPFHLTDRNKHHGGMSSGVFSQKEQTERAIRIDREYEARWRPSQKTALPSLE